MPQNFHRPDINYIAVSRQNDQRYQLLTRNKKRPPTDFLIDLDYNYLIDTVNNLDVRIDGISLGNLPGVNDPTNFGKLLTPDGAGSSSWVFVQANNVLDESLTGIKLVSQAITSRELADGGIPDTKIAPNAVTTIKILDQNVTTNKLADACVITSKLADEAVTYDKMADNAVNTEIILNNAITTPKIADANITTGKIADLAITTPKIADANITTGKIADLAITTPKIANNAITVAQINDSLKSTKALQIAATSNDVFTTPLCQQNHPSALKFWCTFNGYTAGTNPPVGGYNVASITQNLTGDYTITFLTPFANSNYSLNITTGYVTNSNYYGSANIVSKSPNSCRFTVWGIPTAGGAPIQGNSNIIDVSGGGLQ